MKIRLSLENAVCGYCGNKFPYRQHNRNRIFKYCNPKCAAMSRSAIAQAKPFPEIRCHLHGNICHPKNRIQHQAALRKGRAYCSPDCRAEYVGKMASEAMTKKNLRDSLKISQRMTDKNPMRMPDIAQKMADTLKRIGHQPISRGGNGRPAPEAQRILAESLGWGMEYILPTRTGRGSGYPTHYKLDIANPDKKICVEVDGGSHCSNERRQQDWRKTDFLENRGWKVFRFKNEEVESDLIGCVNSVLGFIA